MIKTSRLALLALAGALALAPSAAAAVLVGSLHEHSAYSDGWPGSRPADFYASGRAHGLDFMGGSDHSDNTALPNSFSQYCVDDPAQVGCAIADTTNPLDSFRKWDATAEQAAAATTSTFTAFRGFEWTSDRFGHINVYFSTNYANAKADGGYADMGAFYAWLTRPALFGGGADGLATFNHPGDKKLSTSDPAYNWDDFAYVPAADAQMVGIEVYNSASDFAAPGAHGGPTEGWYAHALDSGWHVGAVGAEDLGHNLGDDWGGPAQAKTVLLADSRSPEAIEAALRARRFYAVATPDERLSYTVDGAPMGSRLAVRAGAVLRFAARAPGADLDLVTNHGQVVGRGATALSVRLPAAPGAHWYFVRATRGGRVVAYSSPVWVTSQPSTASSRRSRAVASASRTGPSSKRSTSSARKPSMTRREATSSSSPRERR
jgi:hypothetical protein